MARLPAEVDVDDRRVAPVRVAVTATVAGRIAGEGERERDDDESEQRENAT